MLITYPNGLTYSNINQGLNQNTQSNGIQLQLTGQNSINRNGGNHNPFPDGNKNNGGITNLINQLLNNQNIHDVLVVQMKLLIEMLITEYNLFRQRALQNINNAKQTNIMITIFALNSII